MKASAVALGVALGVLFSAALGVISPQPLGAQTQSGASPGAASSSSAREGAIGGVEAAFTEALQRGNAAYNEERYADAVQAYVEAAQRDPRRPAPYRNMARAYFWQGSYGAALSYYDTYLTAFPEADDFEQITKERRSTSERASTPWRLPEAQRVAMRNLEAALAAEEAYGLGGSGAYQAYQALLRSGYAQPALGALRSRLFEAIVAEHDERLELKAGQTAPALNGQDWALQRERAAAASELALTAEEAKRVADRELIHGAAEALLRSRYEEAAQSALAAMRANPEAIYLGWFRVTALARASQPERALEALEELEAKLPPEQREYAEVVRAMLMQRAGRDGEAATLYTSVFAAE